MAHPKNRKKIIALLVTLIIALTGALFGMIGFTKKYENKFNPNTYIASINVSNLTKAEAQRKITEKKDNLKTINITYKNNVISATPEQLGFKINVDKTVSNAFTEQKEQNVFTQLGTYFSRKEHKPLTTFNSESFHLFTSQQLEQFNTPVQESTYQNFDEPKFIVGTAGDTLNSELLYAQISKSIETFNPAEITAYSLPINPIEEQDANILKEKITLATANPLTVTNYENDWTIETENIKEYLSFEAENTEIEVNKINQKINTALHQNALTKSVSQNKNITVKLSTQKINEWLDQIAEETEVRPQNARFKIKENNEIELIEPSKSGIEVARTETIDQLQNNLFSSSNRTIILALDEVGAEVNKNNIKSLGITELIAEGTSNFAGSPQNRRHNIEVAAKNYDGILVKPGDTFSFLEYLGDVNAASGYLPELVIKPGKTTKEYGGGICQVSTTVFRGAMNAGLSIVERQRHSFPVQYYAPFGTDATVYTGSPDLKFVNNTENYILIQMEMERNDLKFKFYGKNDGRSVEFEGPHYWDHGWSGPGSLKAKWTQKVTLPSGEIKEKSFLSYYHSPESYKTE